VKFRTAKQPSGALKLAAESLDGTTQYDQFAGQAAAASATVPPEARPFGGVEGEPAAMTFPFRDSSCEAEIGRFSQREIGVTNLLARVQIRVVGTTDASLRQRLSGQHGWSSTNAAVNAEVLTNLFSLWSWAKWDSSIIGLTPS
jgi:hypothetical protein